MKRRLLAMFLLGTTYLTPVPAFATPPVAAFVSAVIGSVSAAVASFGVGLGFAGVTAAGVSGFIVNTVVGLGLSAISAALAPQAAIPSPAQRMANYSQPISYMERGYGRVRKGGAWFFTGFANSKRHYGVLIAAHSTAGPVTHYLDKRVVSLNASGKVVTAPIDPYGNVQSFTGQAGQVANAGFVAAFPEWTEAHDMEELSGAYLTAERCPDSEILDVYPNSKQWVYAPVWDMADTIFDPRDGTYGYSNNAALVFAHEMTVNHGLTVDWSQIAEEADICDQDLINAQGNVQKRWTINGVFSDDMTTESIRAQMMAACDGYTYELPNGGMGLKVGRWQEPTVLLTEADFFAIQVSEGDIGPGVATEFAARYVEPANDYNEAPSGVWVADASQRRVRQETALYLIDSHNQASRITKRLARTARPKYQITGTLSLSGGKLRGQRFARIQHAELGIECYIEIGKLIRLADGGSYTLEAVSTDPEDFAFEAATEEPARPILQTVTSEDDVAVPGGLTAMAQQSSGGSAAITYAWDAQHMSLKQRLRLRATAGGFTDWQEFNMPQGQTSYLQTGLLDGVTYQAQLQNRTAGQRASDWSASVSVQAVVDSTPPSALQSFTATQTADDALLDFLPADESVYYASHIYRAQYASGYSGPYDIADASLIRTEYGIADTSDSYTDVNPDAGHYAYWAVPINASGIAGPSSGPATLTIS